MKTNTTITHYVAGFMFSPGLQTVLLIRKTKPEWQAGKLNGIGGKIEDSDRKLVYAMRREFLEETGLDTKLHEWREFTVIRGRDWTVTFYVTTGDILDAESREEEKVEVVNVRDLPADVIPNLRWLIPLALHTFEPGGHRMAGGVSMTLKEWKAKGGREWKAQVTRDARRAQREQKLPEKQCCFGMGSTVWERCERPAVVAHTFYGFTHGLSLCAVHQQKHEPEYPHGRVAL